MSWMDVQIQNYSLFFTVSVASTLGIVLLSSKLFRRFHDSVYARIENKLSVRINRALVEHKKEIFCELDGLKHRIDGRPLKILEIGAGSGLNFRFYPKGSTCVCLEPKSNAFRTVLRENATQHGKLVNKSN